MRLIPYIKSLFSFRSIDTSLFEYPKWKHLVPNEPTEVQFKAAWLDVFKFDYDICTVEYGKQELMGNILGRGLIVNTPNSLHYCGSFQVYTDDPILDKDQPFYYSGYGCSWATDIIGNRFPLIDPKTGLPMHWDEIYGWEIIKRYRPFTVNLFN